MAAKSQTKSSQSNTCAECTKLRAEAHGLRAKLLKHETELSEFISLFHDMAVMYFPKQKISKIRALIYEYNATHNLQIPISAGIIDGRASAWTAERRAKFGAAVAKHHANKRTTTIFYIAHFKLTKDTQKFMSTPYKHSTVSGYDELAKFLLIPDKVKYIRDRLWVKPDGQTFKRTRDEKVLVSVNKPMVVKPTHQLLEEFQQAYYKKHGIWPNEDQIPDNLLKEEKPPKADSNGRPIRVF